MTTTTLTPKAATTLLRSTGRSVAKRDGLYQVEGGGWLTEHEFLVFADRELAPKTALATQDPPAIGVAMMDQAEARACVERISRGMDAMRADLLDLYDREGWRALGYSSWGACAKAEFGASAATLYRQLEAAEIERNVLGDSQLENLPPIPTLQLQMVKHLSPEQQHEAFKKADLIAGGKLRSAQHVLDAVAQVLGKTPDDIHAAGVQLTRHGMWYKATGFSGPMNGWTSGDAYPFGDTIAIARKAIRERTAEQWAAKGLVVGQRTDPNKADPREPPPAAPVPIVSIPSDIAKCAAQLGMLIDGRTDGLILYWPEESTQQLYPQSLDAVRDWLRDEAPTLWLERLGRLLPNELRNAGYFWESVDPPTIAHDDGWRGDAPTVESALESARVRMKVQQRDAEAAPPPPRHGWWNVGVELSAIQKAIGASDQAAAIAAAQALLNAFITDPVPPVPGRPRDAGVSAQTAYTAELEAHIVAIYGLYGVKR